MTSRYGVAPDGWFNLVGNDLMSSWGWQSGTGIPSVVTYDAPGPVQLSVAPSHSSGLCVIQNDFGQNADSWQLFLNNEGNNIAWQLSGPGPVAGNNLTFTLPNSAPAGYSADLGFSTGVTFTSTVDFYVSEPSVSVVISHVSTLFPESPLLSSQDDDTFTW